MPNPQRAGASERARCTQRRQTPGAEQRPQQLTLRPCATARAYISLGDGLPCLSEHGRDLAPAPDRAAIAVPAEQRQRSVPERTGSHDPNGFEPTARAKRIQGTTGARLDRKGGRGIFPSESGRTSRSDVSPDQHRAVRHRNWSKENVHALAALDRSVRHRMPKKTGSGRGYRPVAPNATEQEIYNRFLTYR